MVLKVFRSEENTGVARDYPTLRVGVVEIPSGHPLIRKLPKGRSPQTWETFVKLLQNSEITKSREITLHELEVAAHNFSGLYPGKEITAADLEEMKHSHQIMHPPRGNNPSFGAW